MVTVSLGVHTQTASNSGSNRAPSITFADPCAGRDALLLVSSATSRLCSSTSMSLTSGGSACGSGQVAVCCQGVPSGGGGALLRTHSGTALQGELCGVGLFLTASGTALTGGPSIFLSVSHTEATLASCFLERERKVCPLPHCQMAFLPLTFTQRVRRDSFLPPPIFL